MEKKLYRSHSDRMIAGVCGGLGEYTDVDPVWIRLGLVMLLFGGAGMGFWVYIILWVIVPAKDRPATTTGETVQANVQEMAERARELGEGIQQGLQSDRAPSTNGTSSGAIIVAVGFILAGALLLLNQFGLFSWLGWGTLWSLALISLGFALLFSRIKE